jgi:REP element-mobilizing transposase RayT
MPNFPNRQSHHLRWFDDNSSQVYFVTICTHDRIHFFGRIRHETMYLNEIGKLSRSTWVSLPDRFPGIQLGDFVFMPNHFHGLIIIYQQTNIKNMPKRFRDQKQKMMEEQKSQLKQPYHPPKLGEIIRTFKAASTRRIRVSGIPNFTWQENYWEEVIRDDDHFNILCNYIQDNPRRWERDTLYKSES